MSSAVTYTSPEMLPKLAEWHVYGNEQQGRFLTKFPEVEPTYYGVDVTEDIRNNIFSRQLGKKAYELKDHLGNVRTTFSDIKMPKVPFNGTYEVDLLSKSEYYPYGMKINDLSYSPTGARYGYNSQEQSTELNLDGNHTTAEFWEYDTRSARRWNLDPVDQISKSNYATFANNSIMFSDPFGDIPTNEEGAKIAGHIYDGKIGDVLDGGWRLDRIFEDKENLEFRAGLYSRTVDGVTEYTMANAGTYFENTERGRGSLSEDIEQTWGGSENVYTSLYYAKKVSRDLGKAELTFVGHSKGGAEAAANALATNRNALLYNPAALNVEAYGLDVKNYTGADDNGMTAYIVKGDMLNSYVNRFFAKPIDKVIYLPEQSSSSITNHLISSVIKALQQYNKTKGKKK